MYGTGVRVYDKVYKLYTHSTTTPGNVNKTREKWGAGWVAEWSKAAVLKTAVGASPPGVRIPPHPLTCTRRISRKRGI